MGKNNYCQWKQLEFPLVFDKQLFYCTVNKCSALFLSTRSCSSWWFSPFGNDSQLLQSKRGKKNPHYYLHLHLNHTLAFILIHIHVTLLKYVNRSLVLCVFLCNGNGECH